MGLPRQVEAQLKEVEAIEKQLQEGSAPPAAQPTDPAPTPPADPAPTPAPADPAPAPAPAEDPTWEQRYRTLKGMFDAEVPRLHAQVKELTQNMQALQAQLAAKPADPTPAPAPQKLVSDEDVQQFGEDLIEVQRKVAREVASEMDAKLQALAAENAKLREQIGQTGQQVAEASFAQRLNQLVPDFATVNQDPAWIAWLDEVDPLIRAPRRVLAQEALSKGDAEGVAHYVQLFRQSTKPAAPPAVDPRQAELERQVQPRRSAAPAAPAPAGRTYSNAEVGAMFDRAARLSAAGQHDEARKLEAEIDAAYMDGRVTP